MIKNLLIFILAVGCASSGKKNVDLDNVTNADFKKQSAAPFNPDKDYFSGVKVENAGALKDESLFRLNQFDGSIESKDIITKIIKNCYEGDYDDAFEIVSREHDRYRNNPAFWNQVGTCYLLKGNKRKALLFYNKSLEFAPSYGPALNNIGVMYRKSGDDQKAEVAFARAIKSSNFSKTPRFNLGQLYLDYGLFKDAIGQFKVLESSKDVDVYAGLGTAYLMAGDGKRSVNYFKRISSDYYERPYIGINAALAFFKVGQKEKARDILGDIDQGSLGPYKKYYSDSAKKVGL